METLAFILVFVSAALSLTAFITVLVEGTAGVLERQFLKRITGD